MSRDRIEQVVLEAIANLNLAREPHEQLRAEPDAPLFGPASPLDSLGLVSLLIDVEEALRDEGIEVTLNDERAMSQTRSPFRSVAALVAYIGEVAGEPA